VVYPAGIFLQAEIQTGEELVLEVVVVTAMVMAVDATPHKIVDAPTSEKVNVRALAVNGLLVLDVFVNNKEYHMNLLKYLSFLSIIISFFVQSNAQSIVDVAESTLKVSAFGEEVFYYGFSEGDQLIFNFTEINGKELKELEITELPSSSKFMDYKTKKIENKSLVITRTAIYKFRFANSAISGRICKFKIQRIPASSNTQNFNSSVYWRTEYDTTYIPAQERYLERSDTIISNPIDQKTSVSSQNAINGNRNRTHLEIVLAEGTIAWSYYIGVGSEGLTVYQKAKDNFINTAAAQISTLPGYGTMAALALYGLNTFDKVQGRDNVKYYFIADWQNVQQFYSGQTFYQTKSGDVITEASQMRSPLTGKFYLGLLNDNLMEPIEVTIKITAIQVRQLWATRTVSQMNITKREIPYLNNN